MDQSFDSVAYRIAYQFGIAVGIGHSEAVRHATLAARAGVRDPQGIDRIIRDAKEEE